MMTTDFGDNERRRKALLDQMGSEEPENTGISGYGLPGGKPTPALDLGGAAGGLQSGQPGYRDQLTQDYAQTHQGMLQRDASGNMPWMNPGQQADANAYNESLFQDSLARQKAAGPQNLTAMTGGQASDAPATPDFQTVGKFGNSMGAWNNNEKFGRSWDDKSERYKMLSVMSHFDPKQGITPELLDALNKANIHGAKFSGSADKLNVENAGGWDRFGTGGTADVIQGFKGGNGTWAPWEMDEGGAQPQGGGGGGAQPGPMMQAGVGGGELDPQLSGDPLAQIKAALAKMTNQRPNMEALMAQLGGG